MAITPTYEPAGGPHELDGVETTAGAAGRLWYLFVVSGVVSAVIGVLVLAKPHPSLKLLGAFIGIDLLAGGVLLIVRGASSRADATTASGAVLLGTLALIAGLIVIRNPGESIVVIAVAFAIFLIVAGALDLGRALTTRTRRSAAVAKGVVLVGSGTVIIAW